MIISAFFDCIMAMGDFFYMALIALVPMAIVVFAVGLIKGLCHVFSHF